MQHRSRPHRRHRRLLGPGLVVVAVAVGGMAGLAGAPGPAGAVVGRSAIAAADPAPGSQLAGGQALTSGDTLSSPNGRVILWMQADGNLVGYAVVGGRDRLVWASGTQGNAGARALMQADGNLVVYARTGPALWSSGTAGHPGAVARVQDDGNIVVYGADGAALWSSGTALGFDGADQGSVLAAGRDLGSGDFLQSPNGRYRLYQTPQGAPSLYQQSTDGLWWLMEGSVSSEPVAGVPTFWSCALCTGAAAVLPGSFLTLQRDGNLVVYPPGGGAAEWSAGLAGSGGVSLHLQDDGNLVVYGPPTKAGTAGAVWQTGTEEFRGTVLGEGISLEPGQWIASPHGRDELVMQADGNLVLYGAGLTRALWSSGTQGDVGDFLTMQADGDLVVYQPGAVGSHRLRGATAPGQGGPATAVWSGNGALNFVALPPEVNSGMMYTGPGSAPLSSASAAWDQLATELGASASGYQSVVSQLSSEVWQGPTGTTVVAAVAPYTAVASAVAQEAQLTRQTGAPGTTEGATSADALPPPVVTVNWAPLPSLVTTDPSAPNAPPVDMVQLNNA